MESLIRDLIIRKNQLQEVLSSAEELVRCAPEGRLRIDRNNGLIRYYHVIAAYTAGEYITKGNQELAVKLAEKDFAERLIIPVKRELTMIDNYLLFLKTKSADHLFKKLSIERQNLISPILIDSSTFSRKWLEKVYTSNPQFREGLRFTTRRGELVRSKTEVFISNTYLEFGIPYRYESPVVMEGGIVRYPDFTLLDIAHHRVVYHEHLGMMEDAEYRKSALSKLKEYAQSGIFTGKNLILTSETPYAPFDPELFRSRIRDTFQVEFLKSLH